MGEAARLSISSENSNLSFFLTILRYVGVAMVGACMFYDRLVDVEALATANANAITVIKEDVATVGRIEEAVKYLKRDSEYQNGRIDDIYRILTTNSGGN